MFCFYWLNTAVHCCQVMKYLTFSSEYSVFGCSSVGECMVQLEVRRYINTKFSNKICRQRRTKMPRQWPLVTKIPVKVLLLVFGLCVYSECSVSWLLLKSIVCLFPCMQELIDVHGWWVWIFFSNGGCELKEAIYPSIHLRLLFRASRWESNKGRAGWIN